MTEDLLLGRRLETQQLNELQTKLENGNASTRLGTNDPEEWLADLPDSIREAMIRDGVIVGPTMPLEGSENNSPMTNGNGAIAMTPKSLATFRDIPE